VATLHSPFKAGRTNRTFTVTLLVATQFLSMNKTDKPIITGIQQIGVGNPDVEKAWTWAKSVGSDLKMFDSADEASLMTRYTGGEVHSRRAIFALNLQGGGGLELWQFTSRVSARAAKDIKLGDLGIFAAKLKCKDVEKAYTTFLEKGINILGSIQLDPAGSPWFTVVDPFGNYYQVVTGGEWFLDYSHLMGGVCGAMIGVSDMDRSIAFYRDILGFDVIAYDQTGEFPDVAQTFADANVPYRRVLLKKKTKQTGFFSELVDSGQIELIQRMDGDVRPIFENRFWGDAGFIHLCFDVQRMDLLIPICTEAGYPFTVDSESAFDMNEASGRFGYIEDPDGTLIEFVEAFKIPILKKLGWYINLEKRESSKPLSKMLFRAMGLNRSR